MGVWLASMIFAACVAWSSVAVAQPAEPAEEPTTAEEAPTELESPSPADPDAPAPAAAPEAESTPEPEPEPERPPADASPGERTAWDAGALVDEGQLSAAEAKASLAVTQPGGKAAGSYQMARIRVRQGRLSDALEHARKAVDADPLHVPAQHLLVRILAETRDATSAVSRLDALANREPQNLGIRLALAEAQLAAGRPADAMRTARSALERAETSVTAMKLLARAYLDVHNPSAARAILERVLDLEDDAEAFLLRGRIALADGEIVRARSWFEQAVEANPAYPEALNNLGYVYLEVRNPEAALEVLDEAVRLAPGYATAWLNLGSARRGLQRFGEAEAAWKKTLDLDPGMSDAWFDLGILYLENDVPGYARIERYRSAIDAFNHYRRGATPTGGDQEELNAYVDEAKLLLDREEQRKQQELKQQEAEPDPEGEPVEEAPPDDAPADDGDTPTFEEEDLEQVDPPADGDTEDGAMRRDSGAEAIDARLAGTAPEEARWDA